MRAEACELTRDKKTKRRPHNLTYVVPKMVLTMGYTSEHTIRGQASVFYFLSELMHNCG